MAARRHDSIEWRPGRDYRIVCECQRHARSERTLWRRSLRFARTASRQLKSGGIALLIGVPLAFGAIGIPGEAMTDAVSVTRLRPAAPPVPRRELPVFTTPEMRAQFFAPETARHDFTVDVVKERFFRTRVPYGSIIYREARKNNLAPELIAAVIRAESDFRVGLVSGKNAQGLMQIVPSTGRDLGAEDLFDPQENIAAGTKYLRYLTDRFGDPRLALAAYNAGEGNIEKFGGVPPFSETRNYIERVNDGVHVYRSRIRATYAASMRVRTSYAH